MIFKTEYKFNEKNLTYEPYKVPFMKKIFRYFMLFLLSVVAFGFYYYLYSDVLGLKSPKYVFLEKNLTEWRTKLEMLDRRIDNVGNTLAELQIRDNSVYRQVLGLNEIPSSIRNAGFGGVERYDYLKSADYSGMLTSTVKKLDILYRKAYIQTKSLDEIKYFADRAEQMASCVPAISPVEPREGLHRISSTYGMRRHPITQRYRLHAGVDIAAPKGMEPDVHVTGDGQVVYVGNDYSGFGNYVVVDHGFGYKTRYAHLKEILVRKGDVLKRGDVVGVMGNSGQSTGTHLHYEVLYHDKTVDPINYFNFNISREDYLAIVNNDDNQGTGNEVI